MGLPIRTPLTMQAFSKRERRLRKLQCVINIWDKPSVPKIDPVIEALRNKFNQELIARGLMVARR